MNVIFNHLRIELTKQQSKWIAYRDSDACRLVTDIPESTNVSFGEFPPSSYISYSQHECLFQPESTKETMECLFYNPNNTSYNWWKDSHISYQRLRQYHNKKCLMTYFTNLVADKYLNN